MSSNKGHVVLPDTAIDEYGADTTRFFLFASSEPWQDFDWRAEDVEQYKNKLRSFYNRSLEFHNSGEKRDHKQPRSVCAFSITTDKSKTQPMH